MVSEFILENRKKFMAHSQTFRSIFGRQLKEFWDPVTGFDPLKFDAFINPPDNESAYEAVLRVYGEAAVQLVKTLIL